ncbi:hypothetical protein [Bradyrhizobium sp. WSM471]|uniref:hypothetical protein n=1 Tax=Bradyrhizobium sp. WSM471 TaxID=319017 RepID=UPI00024D2B64|nr:MULTISPECIES: hypothetical protein [Bradyrhizobium]EHR03677.1 hypothetical protein Bra471DRAFT_04462 [Bradyrhizobium sp. WSM471]UFW38868.1 hypothetical protein BcanWSM471_21840 [Bradyrhizobium canariense]
MTSNSQKCDLLINGQYAYARGSKSAPSGGNNCTMLVDFGGAQLSDMDVRFERTQICGIGTSVVNTIRPVSLLDRVVAYIDGDSWTGPATAATCPQMGWSRSFAKLMGWKSAEFYGLGGTGYVTTGGTLNFGQRAPFDIFLRPKPDALVVFGSTNDGSVTPASTVQTAVSAYIAAVRTNWGYNFPISLIGIQGYTSGYPTAQNAAVAAAVAGANAAGDIWSSSLILRHGRQAAVGSARPPVTATPTG